MNLLKKIFRYLLVGVMLLAGAALVYVASAFFYDDVSELKKKNPAKTAFMAHREIQWEFKGLKNKKITQAWVPLSKISPYMVKAVLIAEDDKFYSHEGFDFEAMQKALEKDIKAGKLKYGGSTISQQLAKNLFLSPSKNPLRKAKEVILTWRIENNLSKRRILELYLNVAEWGDGIFGVEAASRHYYGKPAADLTPMEAARLAVVLPNPLKLNPTGTSKYVEKRAEIVYGIMVRRGIVIEEYDDIMKAPADVPDSGALKSTGVTAGSFDSVEKKDVAADKQRSAAPEKKEPPPPPAAEKARDKAEALPPASKEGR
jgi:monofunctional biosynthetic peptidoglycan transglycosylase